MARWRKIDTRIWGDAKVRQLNPAEKLLWVFLLSHPQQTCLGAFRAHVKGLATELGVSPSRGASNGLPATFQRLVECGLITVDMNAPLIVVNNFLRYNKIAGPNSVKAAVSIFEELPECKAKTALGKRLMDSIVDDNPRPSKLLQATCAWALKRLRSPFEGDDAKNRDGAGAGAGAGEEEPSSSEEGSCSEPKQVRSEPLPVPPELAELSLYRDDANLCQRLPELLPVWARTYPGVDVREEIAKAHAWELANPTRRKTSRGRVRFLNGWLSRSQDRGRSARGAAGASTLDRMLAIVDGSQAQTAPTPETPQ